ncbi:MAG: response regulator [candidate division KSB1 bacterium]|nr:response regulator [candidate division KSB1 bacterium]
MRFLAVDDSPTMLRIIVNTLQRLGYQEVEGASDGVEALEKLRRAHFDLVITDWNMPRMTGLELLQEMRRDPNLKGIPVLMVTTRSVKEDIVQAVKLGACSYVVKPFTPQILKEKIDQALGVEAGR